MIPQLDKMQNADRVEIRPETKCTRFKRFSAKKTPKATHTTGHIQMSKQKDKSQKVTHQLHIIKKVKNSDLEKCMSEQHHVIVYLREDNYRQDQTIQHHMEVMETLQPTSFD